MAQGCAGCLILFLALAVIGAIAAAAETLAQGISAALPLAVICLTIFGIVYVVMSAIRKDA